MNILVVNAGSSSLKLASVHLDLERSSETGRGVVERIGEQVARLTVHTSAGDVQRDVMAPDHRSALMVLLEHFGGDVDAVGHRVVHGGHRFSHPVVLDGAVMDEIDRLSPLAPLHNPPAVAGVRAAMEIAGETVPQVAVFDTGFYHSLPARARFYALPYELAVRHGIRRYGFHGIAHEYALKRYCALTGRNESAAKVISFQLGNGCSVTAVGGGRAVDTSMGFTPLEGLVMGTRSGDVDPAVVGYLCRQEGIGVADVERQLNEQSGLLGISGISGDVRDLQAAVEQGNERAELALDVFTYRAKKYLGAYLSALDGAEAVLFSGGIGEHAPGIRASICRGMGWCGLVLDDSLNAATVGSERRISAESAGIAAYVIPSNEELLIAQETARCLSGLR